MAFNFNWSPLAADEDFYSRAREMLTTALNKSPKPPIIVDDILVNEFNLGSVPPELEILEIGDLAEDRFRGIFKMCYSGDAFLTLKTRVQANPLNTYLFSKPSFTSPQPLAAASGLTIPLQITLSDFKLSAFIILVFSKQKGLTLVFRNDPLESLKVSSTFDSIPFVRDYLQKEIEMQLRTLMMDELPAIIHRLSLRLWCPEYAAKEKQEMAQTEHTEQEVAVDPLSSPPQDAVDSRGNVLDANEISSLSLDGGPEVHSLFSQRSLLRLATLRDSHRTLSLFTPSIPDTVFRAWAGQSTERESNGSNTPAIMTPSLLRSHTYHGSTSTTYTFNNSRGSDDGHHGLPSRPSLVSVQSATTGLSLGAGRHRAHGMKKKKNRVVNLRRAKTTDDMSESGDSDASSVVAASEPAYPTQRETEEPEDIIVTPPRSPSGRGVRFRTGSIDMEDTPRRPHRLSQSRTAPSLAALTSSSSEVLQSQTQQRTPTLPTTPEKEFQIPTVPILRTQQIYCSEKQNNRISEPQQVQQQGPSILEQAWVLKMANEIAQRAHSDKEARENFWSGRSTDDGMDAGFQPPPAYEAEVQ